MSKIIPPIFDTPPLIRKRQKMTVVINKKGRISEKIVMSTDGEVKRTNPKTNVRLVRLEPIMSPIAN